MFLAVCNACSMGVVGRSPSLWLTNEYSVHAFTRATSDLYTRATGNVVKYFNNNSLENSTFRLQKRGKMACWVV